MNTTVTAVVVLGLTILVLIIAFLKRKIDISAIIAITIVGSICLVNGIIWVIPLTVFFIIGNLFSSYKKEEKEKIGIGQKMRTYKNVYGNGWAGLIFSTLYLGFNSPIFFVGFLGTMATALADTAATELGQVFGKNPVLITTRKAVPRGTPGAISKEGLAASFLGSAIISFLALFFGQDFMAFLIIFLSGFLGALLDSLLGCTLEKDGWVDTHDVNFLATLSGGVVAIIITIILQLLF